MNIRKITSFVLFSLFLMFSCRNDDDSIKPTPDRDRAEVYTEDLDEIEKYLSTHFYNYDSFLGNGPYSGTNDSFKIVIDEISEEKGTQNKTSLLSLLDSPGPTNVLRFKEVTDFSGQVYKLYYLVVRPGLGQPLHALDKAVVSYNGFTSNGDSFDSSPIPIPFNLTSLGSLLGVVQGFREGLVEFNTSVGFSEASNGEIVYNDHGIGAVFIPSGLGYFSQPIVGISAYTPIFFTFNVIDRNDTDYDSDNVPSHLEDLNNNQNGFDEDTDGDTLNNFFDNDDDGDGVLTIDEDLEDTDPTVDSDGDGNFTNDKNGDGNPLNDDSDGDGIPNYLDTDSKESRIQK